MAVEISSDLYMKSTYAEYSKSLLIGYVPSGKYFVTKTALAKNVVKIDFISSRDIVISSEHLGMAPSNIDVLYTNRIAGLSYKIYVYFKDVEDYTGILDQYLRKNNIEIINKEALSYYRYDLYAIMLPDKRILFEIISSKFNIIPDTFPGIKNFMLKTLPQLEKCHFLLNAANKSAKICRIDEEFTSNKDAQTFYYLNALANIDAVINRYGIILLSKSNVSFIDKYYDITTLSLVDAIIKMSNETDTDDKHMTVLDDTKIRAREISGLNLVGNMRCKINFLNCKKICDCIFQNIVVEFNQLDQIENCFFENCKIVIHDIHSLGAIFKNCDVRIGKIENAVCVNASASNLEIYTLPEFFNFRLSDNLKGNSLKVKENKYRVNCTGDILNNVISIGNINF